MKKLLVLVVLLVVAFSFSACTYRLVDFTVISSKNTEIKARWASALKAPTASVFPRHSYMKEAIDRAIQQEPGGRCADRRRSLPESISLLPVFEVEGTAINTKARFKTSFAWFKTRRKAGFCLSAIAF